MGLLLPPAGSTAAINCIDVNCEPIANPIGRLRPTRLHRQRERTKMTLGSQAYGEPSYWDNRYTQEPGPFDWYQKYSSLAPLINLYIPRYHRLLVVGCGNSAFGEGLMDDGYEDVVNIDISSVVIDAMQKKYCNCPQLKFMKMDVRDMSMFQAGSFDAVIDKGTLDSILCGNDSRQNATKMLEEVGRVLKDTGIYILITYGAPSYRLRLLKDIRLWAVKLHVVDKQISGDTKHMRWKLTDHVPLDEDETSVEAILGKSPDVHYIYVCRRDYSLARTADHEVVGN